MGPKSMYLNKNAPSNRMTETKYFREALRDELHELPKQPNISVDCNISLTKAETCSKEKNVVSYMPFQFVQLTLKFIDNQ